MYKSSALILSLLLTACATSATHKAAPQNYRFKGEEITTSITGALIHDSKLLTDEYAVGIYIDNQMHIKFALDNQGNGEGEGIPYKGKKTSSTCSSRKVTQNTQEVRCIVFVDNERTVTLTF